MQKPSPPPPALRDAVKMPTPLGIINLSAIREAKKWSLWAKGLIQRNGMYWHQPLLSIAKNGDVTLEWATEEQCLTLCINGYANRALYERADGRMVEFDSIVEKQRIINLYRTIFYGETLSLN